MECYNGNETDYLDLPLSTDGRCGKGHARCSKGLCCNRYGYCDALDYSCQYDFGCQPKYGKCDTGCTDCKPDMTRNANIEYNPNAYPIGENSRCGKEFGMSCIPGYCCNKNNWCNNDLDSCDINNGCQTEFGDCK